MSVPVPIALSLNPPPLGWKSTTPDKYAELVQLVAANLQGSMEVELLTGKVGGSQPQNDIGPWLNNLDWWVYRGASLGYQPSQQGAPVGTVAIWGATPYTNPQPAKWLFCLGQSVTTAQFPALFNAIGYTWGGSGGNFNLPPGHVFYFNCSGAWMNPLSFPPNGGVLRAGQGAGALNQKILAGNMPRLKITIPYLYPNIIDGTGVNVPDVSWQPGNASFDYPVQAEFGPPTGPNQQAIATVPPYVAIYYIIKYI